MQLAKVSACGRFVVLEGLYLDRVVFDVLERWASERDLRPQDAIQLAICAFTEGTSALPGVSSEREHERRVGLLRVSHGVDPDEGALGLGGA